MKMHNPPHPGKSLKECYIDGLGLTVKKMAEILGVSTVTISEIINCKNRITAEMAVRIAKAFSTSPDFWYNKQAAYDIWLAEKNVNTDNIPVVYEPGAISEEDVTLKPKKKNVA